MYYILLHVAAESNDSILHGTTWSTLAYADDIALQDQKPKRMKRMLASMEAEAASVGLRFNPAKCAILHVGAENGDRVLLTSFQIQRKMINPLAQGKSYIHLGIPTGFSAQTPYAAVSDLRAIDRSHLAPWQKKKTLGIFILPRLDFLLWGARVFKGSLTAVDLNIRKHVKSWHNPLQRASSKRVYMLRNWAQDRLPPSCEDIASFLSGSLDGRMRGRGEASLRSSARNAALRQSREISALAVGRGHGGDDVGMSTLECRPREATIKIPPDARGQVVNRLQLSCSRALRK